MVALTAVKASNALLASSLPNLVAVFVGGTSGIGEFTLKAFAQHTLEPRAYLIGRSQEAGDRIKAECQKLNPTGEFIFMKADTSLIRNVDKVCEEIKAKETKINILFLTTGTLAMRGTQTFCVKDNSLAYDLYSDYRREAPHRHVISLLLPHTLHAQPPTSPSISPFSPTSRDRLLRLKRRTYQRQ
jgi:NAD(P)-dependent dehydrogenase (short-subunit alcohol dehydrogenase family)